jgi:mRNA-degrading endonuclease toxin of MazEF toxin-antitoxin module
LVRRGTAFWLELEAEGRRPVCVLTRDEAIPSLRNVVVALITSRKRGLKKLSSVRDDLIKAGTLTVDGAELRFTIPGMGAYIRSH